MNRPTATRHWTTVFPMVEKKPATVYWNQLKVKVKNNRKEVLICILASFTMKYFEAVWKFSMVFKHSFHSNQEQVHTFLQTNGWFSTIKKCLLNCRVRQFRVKYLANDTMVPDSQWGSNPLPYIFWRNFLEHAEILNYLWEKLHY